MVNTRSAVAAGQFYSADARQLDVAVTLMLSVHTPSRRAQAKALVCPHAGYDYSGGVAGQVYASIEPPASVVLIGPDHFGVSKAFSVFSSGEWRTPLGAVKINESLARDLIAACPLLTDDERGHQRDHCLEVQLPFLQRLNPSVTILPILVGSLDFQELVAVGRQLGEVVAKAKPQPLLVASSDLNHYEPLDVSQKKDRRAIRAMLALDPDELMKECVDHHISMCGLGPVVVTLTAAKILGARDAELVDYRTSADAGASEEAVVGYAGIVYW